MVSTTERFNGIQCEVKSFQYTNEVLFFQQSFKLQRHKQIFGENLLKLFCVESVECDT